MYTATITATGPDSTVPDNAGAVDAAIYLDGALIGACTLLPDRDGELVAWGDLGNWADDALGAHIMATGSLDEIVAAVREAAAE